MVPTTSQGRNLRNQVVPVLALLEAAKGHLGAGDVLLGVLEVLEQRLLLPGDALALVGVGVGVAVDGARLAAEQPVQRGADLVAAAGLDRVALRAARLEEVGTLLGVTLRQGLACAVRGGAEAWDGGDGSAGVEESGLPVHSGRRNIVGAAARRLQPVWRCWCCSGGKWRRPPRIRNEALQLRRRPTMIPQEQSQARVALPLSSQCCQPSSASPMATDEPCPAETQNSAKLAQTGDGENLPPAILNDVVR